MSSVENIRGRGYDNGSNTREKKIGVQRSMLAYLVVNYVASCCFREALKEISGVLFFTVSSGIETKVEVLGLLENISVFKFIVALVTRHNALFQVNSTSEILQEKDICNERSVIQPKNDLDLKRGFVDARESAGAETEAAFEKQRSTFEERR
ncbi:hypothetical protein JTB14_020723 [Gonioctena quinquepunctata]|nr:hypothetical protein JTB14_020723 [Gonioctena quinquepunctata]